MKLTISNIAWTAEADDAVLSLLGQSKIAGVEIAPTRVFPDWQWTPDRVAAYQTLLGQHGLVCSSLQAIVYGKPDLKLFGTPAEKAALVAHLKRVADLAVELGARPLVFGAPKNRDRGDLDDRAAVAQAVDVFAEVGDYCAERGVCLCIEPNPPVYACNFVTNSQQGAELVRAVNSPGFRLHLDAAGMHLAGEDIPRALEAAADVLAHVHISEPNLGTFAAPQVDHRGMAAGLRSIGWDQWLSIEMRATDPAIDSVKQAIQTVLDLYDVV
ncbi:sugar phosphate isomerase/epimerase [Leptolyngbya sp. FACHB-36]|uniref:sugar phosphate isomerase/epimerase family protein n=1 Tax=Leptolyngbya sp. FACHB-36 TaxID=2692808 RepID=UPI0016805F70|nr:sugar phosphate isomerase/epimerase [Leptolyngbya sp. FACHB-36]MBD2022041.1 sugar phosphate isomerase/epimerase [Leptolyngbya sp. FACHB-36]